MEKLNVSGIIHDSIVDGPGLRTVIFFQGCKHKCPGCHNANTWSFAPNKLMTEDEIIKVVETNNFSRKITLSGGDPLEQNVLGLAQKLKEKGYDIWVYTGYTLAQVEEKCPEILTTIDVLVDGRFELAKRDLSLKYRGSSNQIIHYLNKKEDK